MAQFSTYKNLELPTQPEYYNIQVFNKNNMVIDSELHKLDLKNESQDELLATKESLNSEITRATSKENDIIEDLTSEIERAKSAENINSNNISEEITRALLVEETINTSLQNHISDETNPHNVTKAQIGLGNVDNTSDMDKPVSTAQQSTIDSAFAQANHYTDVKIADLINGAPEDLDTLKEVSDALAENESVMDALNAAIGTKANQTELNTHINNDTVHVTPSNKDNWNAAKIHADSLHARTDATKTEKSATNGNIKINGTETTVYVHPSGTNPHGTTKNDIGLGNVENKSSATIREELTKENVIAALGYTPPTSNTTYGVVSATANGLMSKTDKAKLDFTNVAYGICDTEAATAAKVVSITGNTNWSLKVGSVICVKYTNTNTASSCTINVNNTGAKQIWYNNAVNTGSSSMIFGYANRHIWYMYDGTYWIWMGHGLDNNTTYSNASLGQGYGTCTTTAATAAKVVTLSNYALTTGGIIAVKFTHAVPASATMNINSKGAKAIYYKGAAITAGIINAGNTAIFIYNGSQYHLLAVDVIGGAGITYSDSEPSGLKVGTTWIGK